MLTNPSNNGPTMISAVPILPSPPLAQLPTYSLAHSLPPSTAPVPVPSARRTLTDQDRRRMCQYHEDNPSVKQTEIGAMFGVERSTVSKVLRQKDKYLCADDGSRSPIKRSKGKFPDIERALSNWARNHQRQGLPLSDSIIRDKARFFATTVGSSESHLKVNSNTWLEKFKQKNHLLGAKPRKASDANDQTFPMVGIEPSFSPSVSCEPLTPTYLQQIMAAPALETPLEELSEQPLGVEHTVQKHKSSQLDTSNKTPNQNGSPASMAPPPYPLLRSSSPNSNMSSLTGQPPSQDEARKALEIVMKFFRHQPSEVMHPQEYIIMGKLMEKLTVQ
ncbi:MAG: hypothetical protein Q9187_004503, partial [Circinaria calcarea]